MRQEQEANPFYLVQVTGCQGLRRDSGEEGWRMGSDCLIGTEFLFVVMRSSGTRQEVMVVHCCEGTKCH